MSCQYETKDKDDSFSDLACDRQAVQAVCIATTGMYWLPMKPLAGAINIAGSNPWAAIDSRVLCLFLLSVKYSRITSYIVGVMGGIFLIPL